jgi:predicted neuraminidase
MSLALISQQRLIPEYGVDFRQCHASTLVVLPEGDLLVAWFAGQKEGSGDTAIWLARREKGRWHSRSAPLLVMDSHTGIPFYSTRLTDCGCFIKSAPVYTSGKPAM